MVHKRITVKDSARRLLQAIEDNLETIKGASFVKQQYIADEMDELEQLVKKR